MGGYTRYLSIWQKRVSSIRKRKYAGVILDIKSDKAEIARCDFGGLVEIEASKAEQHIRKAFERLRARCGIAGSSGLLQNHLAGI